MIADPLTKGLPPMVFHEHTTHMGVVKIEDIFSIVGVCILFCLM